MNHSSKKARARQKSAPGKAAAPVLSDSTPPRVATPLTATPIAQDADWVRLPRKGETICGLRRSYLFQLCAKGTIRSVTIRQPHNTRGVRLIYRPSILAMLASLDLAQNGAREAGQ